MLRPPAALALLLLSAAPAWAQRQNQYDAQGRDQGHTERGPTGSRSYDATGTFTGSTTR